MITLTIIDTQGTMTFNAYQLQDSVVLSPIIRETDVETLDGNISTYYSTTKRQYEFQPVFMDAEAYAQLKGFRDRQYTNKKYPQITVVGNGVAVTTMTAKMTLNDQRVVNRCGLVDGVTITFRESKQMP